jgi:hypothetical protein
VPLRSAIPDIPAERIRRWLEDLPPPIGYSVIVKPLRYRHRPHLFAYTLFDERYIQLQVPEPFRAWMENVYHRARRIPGRRLKFRWYSVKVRMRTRRDVIRFLYCHEFYHWYLWEVRGEKSSAETACDRFALAHFRKQHRHTDWGQELPGYSFQRRRLRRAA